MAEFVRNKGKDGKEGLPRPSVFGYIITAFFIFSNGQKFSFVPKNLTFWRVSHFWTLFEFCPKGKRLRTAIHCPQSFIIKSYFLNIFLYHGSDSVVSVVVVEELLLEAMGVV